MKRFAYHSLIFCLCFSSFSYYGCKKKEKEEPMEEKTPAKQSDQSGSAAADGAIDDVNDYINNNLGGGSNKRLDNDANARLEATDYRLPCGVVRVDTSTKAANGQILYKMVYGNNPNSNCGPNNYKKKSGDVSFQLINGAKFNEKGAQFKLTFSNYTVEILSNGDIVILNGYILVTNVSGGYVWQTVTNNATIQHRVRGSFEIKYANGAIRKRDYFQLRTWSSTSTVPNDWGGLTYTVAGDTTINNIPKISETGKTLENNLDFQTSISEDYSWKNCSPNASWVGPYVLYKGRARMNVTAPISPAYFDVEAGYNYDYNSTTSAPTKVGDCSSNAYKIVIVIGTATSTQYQLY